jgi:hypothetical protein
MANAVALRRIVTEERVQQANPQAEEPDASLAKYAGARTLLASDHPHQTSHWDLIFKFLQ